MRNWLGVTFTSAVLSIGADLYAAQTQPVPVNPIAAQTSLGFNPNSRCPDLRIADEGTIAVVVFWQPRTGAPSQISIKSSSGSDALDAAAIRCVSKLRFAAATRLGDGESIDSWQQVAFRWANPNRGAMAAAPTQIAADARQDDSAGERNSVTVQVCVDEAGKLKQNPTIVSSSGRASLDQAALKIAASGAAYYRPEAASNEPPASGCAQLAIKFDVK